MMNTMRIHNKVWSVLKMVLLVAVMVLVVNALTQITTMAAESTSDQKSYVLDNAGILTDSEEEQLQKLCAKVSDNTELDVIIITTNLGIDGSTMDSYIRNILETEYGYYGNGTNCEAIAYGIDMKSRADRIITSGKARSNLTQSKLDSMREAAENILADGDYYGGCKKFVNKVDNHFNTSIAYKLTLYLPIKLLIALVVAVVAVLIMMYNSKAKMTVDSRTYTKDHNYNVRRREDTFINTTVVTRHIQQNNGGGSSGGGGGNSGSSGGHF